MAKAKRFKSKFTIRRYRLPALTEREAQRLADLFTRVSPYDAAQQLAFDAGRSGRKSPPGGPRETVMRMLDGQCVIDLPQPIAKYFYRAANALGRGFVTRRQADGLVRFWVVDTLECAK